jgi:type II secretory pathway component PulF
MPTDPSPSKRDDDLRPLPTDQAVVVAEVVADAAAGAVPLPDALLAAADDAASRRVANTLRQMAGQLEQGRPLEEIWRSPQQRLPRFVSGLVQAGQRSGNLAEALAEWADCRRTVRQTWRHAVAAIVYPGLLLLLLLMVLAGLDYVLVGPLLTMYDEFQLELPQVTEMLLWVHRWFVPMVACGGLMLAVALLAYRLVGGPARWRRLLGAIPVMGPMWHWTGVMEWSRLLAVLLRRQVALPTALQLAADGVHDANIRQVSQRLVEGVQNGVSLSDLIDSTYRLPATLVPLVRWGERAGQLPEAFVLAGKMYEGRSRLRADLLATMLPPLAFLIIATLIPLFILGLYAPMISMIQGLS